MRWLIPAMLALGAAGFVLSMGTSNAGVECPVDADADECDDVSVTKTAATVLEGDGSEVLAGGTIVYTIEVCNEGETAALEVTFTDQLPLGSTFQSSRGPDFHLAFGETDSQVVGTVAELEGCATAFISVTAAEDAPCGLELENNVAVESSQLDVDRTDNAASTTTEVVCPEPEPEPTATPTTPKPTTPSVGTGDGSLAR